MITIGHMAKTYGMLPSEIAARATTYDIMITDVYQAWEQFQSNPGGVENYSQEQLEAAVKRSKER